MSDGLHTIGCLIIAVRNQWWVVNNRNIPIASKINPAINITLSNILGNKSVIFNCWIDSTPVGVNNHALYSICSTNSKTI